MAMSVGHSCLLTSPDGPVQPAEIFADILPASGAEVIRTASPSCGLALGTPSRCARPSGAHAATFCPRASCPAVVRGNQRTVVLAISAPAIVKPPT